MMNQTKQENGKSEFILKQTHNQQTCIRVHLILAKDSTPVKARYKVTLSNRKKKALAADGPHFKDFAAEQEYEIFRLYYADLYKEENEFLLDDELRILCEIAYEAKETIVTGSSSSDETENSSHSGTMASHFKQLFDNKTSTDVVIDVKGQKFDVHKVVLAARSPVFHAMFQNDLTEKKTNTLEIQDIEPDVFAEVLRFLYTDEINNLDELSTDLLAASDKYMLDLLKAKCEVSLSRNITVESCGTLLILSHLYSSRGLKKKLLDFARSHSDVVVETTSWQELLKSAHPQLLRDISVAMMTTRPSSGQGSNKK